jgi:hypothetical protein
MSIPLRGLSSPQTVSLYIQLLSASSAGQRTLARVTAADTAQSGQEMRSELLLLKETLAKLESEKANLQGEILNERERAMSQLADAEADANRVVGELRRVVGELEEQLKQQVGVTVAIICARVFFAWVCVVVM